MKKLFSLFVLCIAASMITSCSTTPTYTNAIPAKSDIIFSVNAGSILDKSGFYKNESLNDLLLDMVEGEASRELYSTIEDVVGNINKCGIDFSAPVYAILAESYSNSYIYVAKLGKKSSLEDLLTLFNKEHMCSEILDDRGDYDYVVFGMNNAKVLAYNKSSVLFASTTRRQDIDYVLESVIDPLMAQSADESIASYDGFSTMVTSDADAGILIPIGRFIDESDLDQISMFTELSATDILLTSAYGAVNFNKGLISFDMSLINPLKSFTKAKSDILSMYGTVDGSFFPYIAADAGAVATLGFDGKKILDKITKLAKSADSDFEIDQEQLDLIEDMAALIAGDITVAPYGSKGDVVVYTQTTGKKDAKEAISILEDQLGMEFDKIDSDNYMLNLGYSGKYYFGVSGKKMYISTNSLASDTLDKKASKPLSGVDMVTDLKNKIIFAYASADSEYLDDIIDEVDDSDAAHFIMEDVKQVEMSVSKDADFQVTIVLKDDRKNALETITTSLSRVARTILR